MHQPAQYDQPRQRSKLQKPADSRGHKYTDSGVGITESEPIQSSESNWRGPSEAVGGGTYIRDNAEPIRPLESIISELGTSTPTEEGSSFRSSRGRDLGLDVVGRMADSKRFDNTETTSRSQQSARDSPPYWGDLPKGAGGGVYNTVTGHGSATDDHDEHHHIHPKGSGVYNTVIGHGSQDDELRRNSLSSRGTSDERDAAAAFGPVDDMYGTFLPDIPEQQTPVADTLGTAPGFLPETAVQDDVRLAEAATARQSGPAPQRAFPLGENREDRHQSSSPSRYGATAAGAAGIGAGIAASEYVGHRRSDSNQAREARSRSRSNPPVARAVAGKRGSSSQRSPALEQTASHDGESAKDDKKHRILGLFHRHKDDRGEASPTSHRRKSSVSRGRVDPDVAAVNPASPSRPRKLSKGESTMHRLQSRSRSRSKVEPESEDHHRKEKAAAGTAVGAGALGVLHHHKKKNSISEPQDARTSVSGLSAAEDGVGPTGELTGQVQGVSTPFEHPREPPMPPQAEGQTHGEEHGHYNVLASGTPSGVKHATNSAVEVQEASTASEPGKYNTLASGTPSGVNATAVAGPAKNDVVGREAGDYNTLQSSGAPNAQNTGRDVVSSQPGDYNILASTGHPAPQHTRRDVAASEPSDFNVMQSSGAPDPELTRKDVVRQEPGDYTLLKSSGTSQHVDGGISGGHRRSSVCITQHGLGNYGTLAAAIPAGIEQRSSTSAEAQQTHNTPFKSNAVEDTASVASLEYNTLPSGTPSGVKVKPKPLRRSADHSRHADDQPGHEQYNTLASGTTSGISPEYHSQQRWQPLSVHQEHPQPEDITTRAADLKDLPLPPTAVATSQLADITRGASDTPQQQQQQQQQHHYHQQHPHTAAIPSRPLHHDAAGSHYPNPSQDSSVPGITTYPHPEMMHMSPEVMPDAYTSSVPRHSGPRQQGESAGSGPGTGFGYSAQPPSPPQQQFAGQGQHHQNTKMAQDAGPEAMPAAYAEEASRQGPQGRPQVQGLGQQQGFGQQPQQQQQQDTAGLGQHENAMRERSVVNPALAAATTSWASSAGKSSGVAPGASSAGAGMGQGVGQRQGKVMHKCQHCGKDNDISGYFEKAQDWVGKRF
ncbi:hypothetical protein VTI74DRAFT_10098 [Chaetomium olivicolor]